jgi:hypothetical protein
MSNIQSCFANKIRFKTGFPNNTEKHTAGSHVTLIK